VIVLLICYDGSIDAQAAIDQVGELMSGEAVSVLTVWDGLAEVLALVGARDAVGALDFEAIDAACEQAARQRADEGVRRARDVGLNARARVAKRAATISETIIREADAIGASAIVLGCRGLTGFRSVLLGSVSTAVLQHADRPVIVVPSPEIISRRTARH
jgi:nucleotide-binding universal stress UspA family protein